MAYVDIMLERAENFIRTVDPSERSIHLTQFLQVPIVHKLRQGWGNQC